jgi:hypothetical protein
LRKRLIAFLLLILPLQGIAAVVAPLQQSILASAAAAMPCHDLTHSSDALSVAHDVVSTAEYAPSPPSSDTPRDADAMNHSCCHQVFTCSTMNAPTAPAHKFGDVPRFVLQLATLFIPDSLYRPPRG